MSNIHYYFYEHYYNNGEGEVVNPGSIECVPKDPNYTGNIAAFPHSVDLPRADNEEEPDLERFLSHTNPTNFFKSGRDVYKNAGSKDDRKILPHNLIMRWYSRDKQSYFYGRFDLPSNRTIGSNGVGYSRKQLHRLCKLVLNPEYKGEGDGNLWECFDVETRSWEKVSTYPDRKAQRQQNAQEAQQEAH